MPPFAFRRLGWGLGMDPAPSLDAFAVPIYEPIFSINTYGQPPRKGVFPANDVYITSNMRPIICWANRR